MLGEEIIFAIFCAERRPVKIEEINFRYALVARKRILPTAAVWWPQRWFMDASKLWPDALALYDAWWILSPEAEKEKYRDAGKNPHRTVFLQRMMRGELVDRLHRGELICLGVRTAPEVGAGPEVIQTFLFSPSEIHIDWNKSTIRSLGHAYEGVRVVRPDAAHGVTQKRSREQKYPRQRHHKLRPASRKRRRLQRANLKSPRHPSRRRKLSRKATIKPLRQPSKPKHSRQTKPKLLRPTTPQQPKPRLGRPPVGEQLQNVVRALIQEGKLTGVSRKQQEAIVRERARALHPRLFLRLTQPSRTKILQALKAEGL